MTITTVDVRTPTPTPTTLPHRHLLDDVSWGRVSRRIANEAEFQRDYPDGGIELAERILNEALGFLTLCATDRRSFGPTPIVDIGWHALILYTDVYTDLCDSLAGGYMHHIPNDMPGQEDQPGTCRVARTECDKCGQADPCNRPCRNQGTCHGPNVAEHQIATDCSGEGHCKCSGDKLPPVDLPRISTVEGFQLHGIAYDELLWVGRGKCDKVGCACREHTCRS